MSDDSDSWKTWTSSYGERCLENEQSLQDVLLGSKENKSESYKKCIISILIGVICFIFFL